MISEYRESGSKNPEQLVILLHGYGSNYDDLITLAPELIPYLPKAKFISVNAPLPFEGDVYGGGRQWFSLMDRNPIPVYQGAAKASVWLKEFIARMSEQLGIPYDKIALLGFSQGSMLAMQTAYRLAPQIAGVLCYSGMLARPETLAAEIVSRPPAMLIHGEEDQVLPPECMGIACKALEDAGVSVDAMLRPFLGHGIDGRGIHAGGEFLQRILPVGG